MKAWTVDDVMTEAVVSVSPEASYRDVVDLLVGGRFSAVPVVDAGHRVTGVVSEADLVRKIEYAGDEEPRLFEGRRRRGARAKALGGTAGELMSTPAVTVRAGTPLAAAARLLDAENVKRLPVVDEQDRLVGIVTRGDLIKVHLRPDDEIRADVLAGQRATVSVRVRTGVVTLTGRVDRWSDKAFAVRAARQVAGVAGVVDELTFEIDDREAYPISTGFGAA